MIVVFGSINLDLIFALPRIPLQGETVLGPSTRIEPGGKGANQAVAAARDGATVVMAGAIGRDTLGDSALTLLRQAGVNLDRVIRTAEAGTGCAAIAVDPAGNNAIAVGSGANLLARASQVEDPLLGPNATVLVQMEMLASETADVITRAKAAGARILLNLAPAGALPEAALRAVDILVVNETEGAWLAAHLSCADNAAAIRGCLDVAAVVLTQGADGADIASRDASWHEPARQVEVVDTTAAGDCFVGVLAHQLDCGKSLRAAVQRASIAAALCCANSGSQGSIPIQSEITLAGHLAHPRNNSPHCLASFP